MLEPRGKNRETLQLWRIYRCFKDGDENILSRENSRAMHKFPLED